jgi:diacylglycerol kinase (ATP)
MAVVPRGTGMDFVRTYGIPTKVEGALEVAAHGSPRTIDLGRVSYRTWGGEQAEGWFANIASAGMSGAVARRANSTSKALGGKASFFIALVAVFASWRNVEVTVRLEGAERSGLVSNVIVANGQYQGGKMWIAPEARPDDGLFDVLVIGDITKPDFVRNVGRIYRGTHLTHPKIELLKTPWVEVDAAEPLPIELDGEQPGTTPVRFEVAPRALRVRVPAEA